MTLTSCVSSCLEDARCLHPFDPSCCMQFIQRVCAGGVFLSFPLCSPLNPSQFHFLSEWPDDTIHKLNLSIDVCLLCLVAFQVCVPAVYLGPGLCSSWAMRSHGEEGWGTASWEQMCLDRSQATRRPLQMERLPIKHCKEASHTEPVNEQSKANVPWETIL